MKDDEGVHPQQRERRNWGWTTVGRRNDDDVDRTVVMIEGVKNQRNRMADDDDVQQRRPIVMVVKLMP